MLQKLGVRDVILRENRVDGLINIGDLIETDEFPDPSILQTNIESMKPVFTQEAWDHVSAKGKLVSLQILL